MQEAKDCGVHDAHGFKVGFCGDASIRLTKGNVDAIFDDALGAKFFLMGYDRAIKDMSDKKESTTIAELKFDIDYSGAVAATEAMNNLAEAIERVENARRGPVEYAQVGEVFTVKFGDAN